MYINKQFIKYIHLNKQNECDGKRSKNSNCGTGLYQKLSIPPHAGN